MATCGDKKIDAGEECDDGGICVGSPNAGTACSSNAECPGGGICKPFGGDGCAVNCTNERDVPYDLVPGEQQGTDIKKGTSGVIAHSFISLPVPLTGGLTLTIGKERDGQIPAVVKANSVTFPGIDVMSMACGCVHGAEAKTCGGLYQNPDGSLAEDCTMEDKCAAKGLNPCTYVHGAGNTASGVIGCNGLENTDLFYTVDAGGDTGEAGEPVITLSGSGGPGSSNMLITVGVDVVLGKCTGSGKEYGPDGQFCTADDNADIGVAATNPAVTGNAAASVTNLPDGDEIGPVEVSGSPFNCQELAKGNPGGAELVSAFAIPEVETIGAIAVTIDFVAQSQEPTTPSCGGDCGGDGEVTVDEIIVMVNIALEATPVSACLAGDTNSDGTVTVDEIIGAVNNALNGCPQ